MIPLILTIGASSTALTSVAVHALRPDPQASAFERMSRLWPMPGIALMLVAGAWGMLG